MHSIPISNASYYLGTNQSIIYPCYPIFIYQQSTHPFSLPGPSKFPSFSQERMLPSNQSHPFPTHLHSIPPYNEKRRVKKALNCACLRARSLAHPFTHSPCVHALSFLPFACNSTQSTPLCAPQPSPASSRNGRGGKRKLLLSRPAPSNENAHEISRKPFVFNALLLLLSSSLHYSVPLHKVCPPVYRSIYLSTGACLSLVHLQFEVLSCTVLYCVPSIHPSIHLLSCIRAWCIHSRAP